MGSTYPDLYHFFCFTPTVPYTLALFAFLGDFVSYLSGGKGYFITSSDVVSVSALFIMMFVIYSLHSIMVYFLYRFIDKKYMDKRFIDK